MKKPIIVPLPGYDRDELLRLAGVLVNHKNREVRYLLKNIAGKTCLVKKTRRGMKVLEAAFQPINEPVFTNQVSLQLKPGDSFWEDVTGRLAVQCVPTVGQTLLFQWEHYSLLTTVSERFVEHDPMTCLVGITIDCGLTFNYQRSIVGWNKLELYTKKWRTQIPAGVWPCRVYRIKN